MNLLAKQSKRDFIIATLEQNYGEEFNNETEQIQKLKEEIQKDVETYGLMIVDKDFEARMEKLRSIKKEIDSQIKYLESEKVKIKYQLANYLEENGPAEIETPEGRKYLKVGYTEKRDIDIDKVEEPYGKYILTLTGEEHEDLFDFIKGTAEYGNIVRKVLLADLPEDHPAISKQMNPQIKLTKKL